MATKIDLLFTSYTYLNAAEGVFLFFPAVDEKSQNDAQPLAPAEGVSRVTIEIVEHSDLEGIAYVSEGALKIDLDRARFVRLRRALSIRDVRYAPVSIRSQVNERGLTNEVIIDDVVFAPLPLDEYRNEAGESEAKALAPTPKTKIA